MFENEQDIREALSETMPTVPVKTYNKYQVSKMFGDGYQIVIRTDTYDELKRAMTEVKPLVDGMQNKPKTEVSQPSGLSSICPIHNVPMVEKDGQYGPYWSHIIRDVGFCDGKKIKPFKK